MLSQSNVGTDMLFSHFVIMLLTGLLVMCGFVAISDYRHRRIPNKYLIVAATYALCIFASMLFYLPASAVLRGFMMSVMGMVLGGLFLYPSYMIKQVGAGDVKLVMVFGLFMGMRGVILTVLIGAMIGGLWALCLAWKHGGLGHMWYNMKFMARSAYLTGFKDLGWDLKSANAIKMPYGVALCGGATLVAIEQLHLHIHKLQILYQAMQ